MAGAASEATLARPLRVGVTLFIRDDRQSLWENGIFQNVYFLLHLLALSPAVERCFIVNGGPGDPASSGGFLDLAPAPVLTLEEAMNALDVVIEFSAQLSAEWVIAFKAKGGTVISMKVANDQVIDAERAFFNLPHGQLFGGAPIDAVWMLPAFEKTCRDYYRIGFRAPVHIMPHLWSPSLLLQSMAGEGAADAFRYQPGAQRWRLGVLEPNICSVKTCHVPMLACDEAYRRDRDAVAALRVFSAVPIKDNVHFIEFARSLDLVCHGIASFEARFAICEIMGHQIDAVVSHHWENPQNYLYYEALYGGFPLIHNSDLLADCGYRYRDFDPEDGGLAILQAKREHDRNLEDYHRRAQSFLAGLSPTNPANVAVYTKALLAAAGCGATP